MNRFKIALVSAVCVLALSPALISCGNSPKGLTPDNQAGIYASVIKRLYRDFGDGQGGLPIAYIMKHTDDSGGVPGTESSPGVISESLQNDVVSELANTDKTYVWVSDWESEVPHDEIFSGTACQIILGNIHPQENHSVQVTASLYYGGTGGGGTTFILELIDGTWTVTGTTGPIWLS